jgi:hypothetical protein
VKNLTTPDEDSMNDPTEAIVFVFDISGSMSSKCFIEKDVFN